MARVYVWVCGYACESVDQGGETCHLISLLARAEFIHQDDLEVALGCYVNWSVNRELKQVVSMAPCIVSDLNGRMV